MPIRMILMSGADPWLLLVGLLPQETDRRCDLTGVDGVSAEGVNAPVFGEHECTLAMGLECLHLPIRLQFESLKHTLIVGHAVA